MKVMHHHAQRLLRAVEEPGIDDLSVYGHVCMRTPGTGVTGPASGVRDGNVEACRAARKALRAKESTMHQQVKCASLMCNAIVQCHHALALIR